jgi:hypothetical protein
MSNSLVVYHGFPFNGLDINGMRLKPSSRTFVKGPTAGSIFGVLGLWRTPVSTVASPGLLSVFTDNDFDLYIDEAPVSITCLPRAAMPKEPALFQHNRDYARNFVCALSTARP